MDLNTLKNLYAQEQGYDDWADLYRRAGYYDETKFFKHENEVIILAQKAALEKAADNAKTTTEEYYVGETTGHIGLTASRTIIDLTSITKPQNLIR